jgi:hypothetical protein
LLQSVGFTPVALYRLALAEGFVLALVGGSPGMSILDVLGFSGRSISEEARKPDS